MPGIKSHSWTAPIVLLSTAPVAYQPLNHGCNNLARFSEADHNMANGMQFYLRLRIA